MGEVYFLKCSFPSDVQRPCLLTLTLSLCSQGLKQREIRLMDKWNQLVNKSRGFICYLVTEEHLLIIDTSERVQSRMRRRNH